MKTIKNISFIMLSLALVSCGGSKTNEQNDELGKDSIAATTDTSAAEQSIFYNAPSPIETFTLLKFYGGSFDKALLNSASNMSKYTSSAAKAINLGIYSTDLSFSFMYEQKQAANTLIKSISELTTALGIDGSYGQEVYKRIKENENSFDSLSQIVSEATVNTDIYLKENQRNSTVALIAAGAWIESLYIISNIANNSQTEEVTSLLADQKITIAPILKMLEQNSSDADAAALANDIKEIAALFESLESKTTTMVASTDKSLMSVGDNKVYTLSKEQMTTIVEKTKALRNKLTN